MFINEFIGNGFSAIYLRLTDLLIVHISFFKNWKNYLSRIFLFSLLFIFVSPAYSGLSGSNIPAQATVNLTAEGSLDWIHWGLDDATSLNRKAGIVPAIDNFSLIGGLAPNRFQAPPGARVSYSWNDGVPTAVVSDTTSGVYITGLSNGFQLTIPANSQENLLKLYVGAWSAKAKLEATFSDGSVQPYVTFIDNPTGPIDRIINIQFSNVNLDQSLIVRYTIDDPYAGGNITLQAAALQQVDPQENLSPVAVDDIMTVDNLVQASELTVLANDYDPNLGDGISITNIGIPNQGGSANISSNGDFISYLPASGYFGEETFVYTITDSQGLTASANVTLTVSDPASSKPNIIFILTDDLGYQDLGVYGSTTIRTPNLDQLASKGVRFTDFYAAPVCGPYRASLMTGSYAPRLGMTRSRFPNDSTGINPDEITVAELLKPQGYTTGIFGKWHLGDHSTFMPLNNGFDQFYGLPYSNDMWPFHPLIEPHENEDPRLVAARERAAITGAAGLGITTFPVDFFPDMPVYDNQQVIELNPDQATLVSRFTEQALGFIEQNQNQPFFLYLPLNAPHVPLFPSPQFLGQSQGGLYGDVVEEIDWNVGRIIAKLTELNLEKDTLVVFSSDNGPWLEYGIDGGSAGPLKGGKGTNWEGGIRVPMIMSWPGRIPEGVVNSEMASHIDLYPTFGNLAGATIPTDRVIDGKDLWPLMSGQPNATTPHEALYFYNQNFDDTIDQTRSLEAVRAGKWKLHVNVNNQLVTGTELYDLSVDAVEQNNLFSQQPDVVNSLQALAQSFNDQLRQETRPIGQINEANLSGVISDAPASVDLSLEGNADWAHWGLIDASSFNHKSGVNRLISDLTPIGGEVARFEAPAGARVDYGWSGGTPIADVSATTAGVFMLGVGNSFELTVPADTTTKTIKLYVGAWTGRGRLEATLSDGSASPYVATIDNPNGAIDRLITLQYKALSDGQSLRISYTLVDNYGIGNITFSAAALQSANINNSPTLLPIDNKSVVEGQVLDFIVTANDPDGPAPLSINAGVLPAGASFTDYGDGTGRFYWVTNSADTLNSPYSITFSAIDGSNAVSQQAVLITINQASVNQAPNISNIADQNVVEGNRLVLPVSAVDADGPAPIVLTTSSLPSDAIFSDNGDGTGSLEWATSFGASVDSPYYVTFIATDSDGAFSEITTMITVTAIPVNEAPAMLAIGDREVIAGNLLSVSVNATDSDGPAPIILTTSLLPSGAEFIDDGTGAGVLNWTPSEADVINSPYNVTFTATDGAGAFSEQSIAIRVDTAPSGGLLLASAKIPTATVNLSAEGSLDWAHWGANSAISLNRKASVASQISDYTLLGAQVPSRFQPPAGIRILHEWNDGTPVVSDSTNAGLFFNNIGNGYQLSVPADTTVKSLRVYLGAWSAEGIVQVSLSDNSAVPFIASVENLTGPIDRVIDIEFSAASEGQTLTLIYTMASGVGNVTLNAATFQSVETNQAPTLTPVLAQTVMEGNLLRVPIVATDVDGPAPIGLTASALPNGASFSDQGNGNGTLSWTPGVGAASSEPYLVTLTATDNAGAFSEQSVSITVTAAPVNQAPALTPVPAQTVMEGNLLRVAIVATDVDGPAPIGLTASALPNGASFSDQGNGNGTLSWTPGVGAASSESYLVTLTATDNAGAFSEQLISITVTAAPVNQAPTLAPVPVQTVMEGNLLRVPIVATDVDGPAPISLSTATLPTGANFTDNGDGTGLFEWSPPIGASISSSYIVAVIATDADGNFNESTFSITVLTSGTAVLTGSSNEPPSGVILSNQGTTDWAHWGLTDVLSFNHKASVNQQISNISMIGNRSPSRFQASYGRRAAFAWNSGIPTSYVNYTSTGIYVSGEGNGFEVSIPASTTEQTLKLYVGAWSGRGRLEASLSDGSVSPYVVTVDNRYGVIDRVVTLNFKALSNDQVLNVRYILEEKYWGGNVSLSAATLYSQNGDGHDGDGHDDD